MTFKMAIIGMGGMANWHYTNIKKYNPGIIVTGAYDIRGEVKEDIVKLGLKSYSCPEELYEDTGIDLVLIAAPNDVHKHYAIACLKSGKHVVCEKPVTLNAAELEEIIAAAEECGKLFTIHQNRRWDSDYLTVRKILGDGILKNPYTIESRVQGSRRGMHGWRGHKVNGGGMVLDWGVHLIDQMMDLIPEKVISVCAHLHYVNTKEVDDIFTAMLRFESGLSALINISMNCFIVQPRWHICCEDGTAIIEDWELNGKIVKLADDTVLDWSEEIVYTAAGPTRSMAPRPSETTSETTLPIVRGEWIEFYRNIADTLNGDADLIVTPAQALRVMKVIDAVFESQRTGASISCNI